MSGSANVRAGFRGDINGLRAWAVFAVMFYHFGVPGFSGGFVGVDVFFVISGFLMTGIVVKGLERSDFSLIGFYVARARRIIPALAGLCIALLALGWWVLIPIEYRTLGAHAVYSLTFISNINFWLEAGYFDVASHEKWLLHTWSLAVEWQFYLLLPIGLLAVWRLRPGRRSITMAISGTLLASVIWSLVLTPMDPSAAFFLLPTRAWEMLAGGLVFLLPNTHIFTSLHRTILETMGIALIILSVLIFDSSSVWPGWRALLPVIGTVLVLVAARLNSIWTGNVWAQWLGTRSYSLYLWHWPIAVAVVYLGLRTDPVAIATGLGLTLFLGHVSYRLIESPALNHLAKFRHRWAAVAAVCIAFLAAAPSAAIRLDDGVPSRISTEMRKKIATASHESDNKNPRIKECHPVVGGTSPSCLHGGAHLRAILMGDSHANAVVSGLAGALRQTGDGVMEWTYSACPIIQGAHTTRTPDKQCSAFVDWAMLKLRDIPKEVPVVIVYRYSMYVFGYNELSDEVYKPWVYFSRPYLTAEPAFLKEYAQHLTDTACLIAKERPVYLVRPIPEMGVNIPTTMARALMRTDGVDFSISLDEYRQRQDFIWAAQDAAREQCGVKILDPLPYLCHDGRCYGAKSGRPIYYDDDHLSESGNKLLVPMFAEVFKAP